MNYSYYSDFGDMGAAAKSYTSAEGKKKGWGGEEDNAPREPRPEDHNKYRNHHGLTVMDRAAQNAGKQDGTYFLMAIGNIGVEILLLKDICMT